MLISQIFSYINVHFFINLSLCCLCCIITVFILQWATVSACYVPCCTVLSSLYCYVIASLNKINGDGEGYPPAEQMSQWVGIVSIRLVMAKLVNYISLNCREHSDGANLHQGKTSRGKFCHGGRNVWDTVVGGRCRKSRFLGETFISSPGLTLKRAPRSQSMAMAPLDRTHLLVFYNNFGRISCRFCATVDFMPFEMTLLGDCDL